MEKKTLKLGILGSTKGTDMQGIYIFLLISFNFLFFKYLKSNY